MMQIGNPITIPLTNTLTRPNSLKNIHSANIQSNQNNPKLSKSSKSTSTSTYGRKTDIWSLGITLIEMALGKSPFRSTAAAIYSICILKEYPKFPNNFQNNAKDFLSK